MHIVTPSTTLKLTQISTTKKSTNKKYTFDAKKAVKKEW